MQKNFFRVTAAVVFFLGAFTSLVKGESVQENGVPTGLMPTEEITIFYEETDASEWQPEDGDISAENSALLQAADDTDVWINYSNYYIYNQMTDDERTYWDGLNEMCAAFISTETDAFYSELNQVYYLSGVTSDSLTLDEMKEVFFLFKYANPQYYFINNKLIKMKRGDRIYISPGIYSAFAEGGARMSVTEQMFAQVESWKEQLALCETKADQVRLAHDLILEKVSYNNRIYNSDFDEDTEYSQSVYSVFCLDTTVCAGYSQALELLCNSMGIPAIAVTSETHEWNKVRIDDSWYNIDCTWDDGGSITYAYFERSDQYYDTVSSRSAVSHREEAIWDSYLPFCTLDAIFEGQNYSAPGILPEITKKTETPVISITAQLGMAYVSFSCETEDAIFYYTLDGSKPSCAGTKSQKYEEAFSAPWGTVITVLAVKDACFDSGTVKEEACMHNFDIVVQNASCTADGVIKYSCLSCGSFYTETVEAALGHVWDDGVVTKKATADQEGVRTYTCGRCRETRTETIPATGGQNTEIPKPLRKGDTIKWGDHTYQVTSAGKTPAVKFMKAKKSVTALAIPASIKVRGVTYKVTAIAGGACQNNKKLQKVTIGKNVTKIGKNAFRDCKKLSVVTVKAEKLSSIGKNALKGICPTARVRMPAKKMTKYKKLFSVTGLGKKVRYAKLS